MQQAEKQKYIDKLKGVSSGIGELTRIQRNSVITPQIRERLLELKEQAEKFLPKLENNEFEIAVVGLESSGKSSFANALAGVNALPTADKRCTYTSTCVMPGVAPRGTVSFYSDSDFTNQFKDQLRTMGVPGWENYTPRSLSLEEYERLFAALDADTRQKYENNVNSDIADTLEHMADLSLHIGKDPKVFNGEELEKDRFLDFITEPRYALAVKSVVIESPMLGDMGNAVLYDVPGFNSPTAIHQAQTLARMRDADAIIVVAKADEPSLTSEVLTIFDKLDDDGTRLKDKLFVFANKADRATDLEDNKEITIKEWVTKRHIVPAENTARIIFGSAAARMGNVDAQEALRRKGIDDGIDDVRQKLLDYYAHDRFEVLKMRIDRMLDEVERMFEDVRVEDTPIPYTDREWMRHATHRVDDFRMALIPALDTVKAEINERVHTQRPLAEFVRNHVQDGITVDKYGVEDSEIESLHRHHAGNDPTPQPDQVDLDIRRERFQRMYDDFARNVLDGTDTEHIACRDRILNCFMAAMDIKEGTETYAQLKPTVEEFCGLSEEPDNGYYQSLVERFARDLFEILIKFSRSTRAKKFRMSAANLLSLGVFYDASQDQSTALPNIDQAPRDSVMWKMLLYPSRASSANIDAATEKLVELTHIPKVSAIVSDLVGELVTSAGQSALPMIERAFADMTSGHSEAALVSDVKSKLRELVERAGADVLTLQEVLDGRDVPDTRTDYSAVQRQFAEDVDALRTVLTDAVVPAVNLDTAFSARESKLVEDIEARIGSADFTDFVVDNFHIIEAAKFDELERARTQNELDRNARQKIKAIVTTIVNGRDEVR